LAIVSALYYRYEYLQLQGQIDSVINVQEVKVEYIEKIIEKENIIYKDKIKYIKEYIYNDNKTKCENAISLIRSTNL
jgi:hypothetical protein